MKFSFPLAVVVASFLVAGASAQSAPHSSHRKPPVQKEAPPTPVPEPVVPLSPEQMPASPPQVAFSGGILTITANNATLGDILRAVHRQTGAAVDVPGNATERVVGIFGPGPVRDVMTLLLNGSHFNYVLLGSATDPGALEKVVLISKSTGMEPVSQSNVAASQFRTASNVPQAAENADASTDDAAEMPQEAGDAVEDQANQSQPEEQQQPQQANPFGQRGGVKTPEQLLQELQQRQQQMQQQQQQQGSPQSLPPAPTGAPQQSQPQ